MRQHPRGFVLAAKVAAQRQGGLALDLVAEDHDGGEVNLQRQLVEREQGAAGEAEILAARLAAEPQRAIRTARLVVRRAGAMWADSLAVRLDLPDAREHRLGLRVRHAAHLGHREAAGAGGKEKVLRHLSHPSSYKQICKLSNGHLQGLNERLC